MARNEAAIKKREDELVRLYEVSYGKVARYVFIRIGNQQDAEDLASETFVRALKSIDSYQERGLPMEAWIFKIAHNLVVDYLREMSKKQMVMLEEVTVQDSSDPQEMAEMNIEIEEMSKALGQLSTARREVIALRFFAELTSEETGKILGKKPSAVREMQRAAVSSLRTILASA